MKTILAKVEKAKDGTYSVYAENFDFSGMGKTLVTVRRFIHFVSVEMTTPFRSAMTAFSRLRRANYSRSAMLK